MMKKFTHEVGNLRVSLHILFRNVKKVYTEQTCVNLCKLRQRFTHIHPPMERYQTKAQVEFASKSL